MVLQQRHVYSGPVANQGFGSSEDVFKTVVDIGPFTRSIVESKLRVPSLVGNEKLLRVGHVRLGVQAVLQRARLCGHGTELGG